MPDQPDQATMEKGQQVAAAGAEAAAAAPPDQAAGRAAEAMRAKRDQVKLEMSDEDIDRLASVLSPKLIDGFREQGAFDPPMEQPAGPQNVAPPPPGDPAEGEPAPAAAAGEPAPAPVKRTFAHRYMGIR